MAKSEMTAEEKAALKYAEFVQSVNRLRQEFNGYSGEVSYAWSLVARNSGQAHNRVETGICNAAELVRNA